MLDSQSMKATLEEVEKGVAEDLHRVKDGETIVVYEGTRAVQRSAPRRDRHASPGRSGRGEFIVPDDFDEPLPDAILDA